MKECNNCFELFIPSSRHKACPKCRAVLRKKNCPLCNQSMTKDSHLCINCSNAIKPMNGRTYHKKGYVMVYKPRHPRAISGSYVFEHILVMERMIGRFLYKDENVHHKNGVKDDNRPDNLELWSTYQPAGQRVEDKLVWATEIIRRYS